MRKEKELLDIMVDIDKQIAISEKDLEDIEKKIKDEGWKNVGEMKEKKRKLKKELHSLTRREEKLTKEIEEKLKKYDY